MTLLNDDIDTNWIFEIDGGAPTMAAVSFWTHDGRVEWEIRPTNPVLEAGKPLPDVVFGNVHGVKVDGESQPTNRTYVRWDVAVGTVTFASRPIDPGA